MATLKGLAVRWGIPSTAPGLTATLDVVGVIIDSNRATPKGLVQSADLTWTSDKTELTSSLGETVGMAFHKPMKTFTISVIPAATDTEANAIIEQDKILVAPGTKVVIDDPGCAKTETVPTCSNYIAEGSRLRRTNTGAAVVEIDLVQYFADLSATTA